jgi:aspartate/methionine/tyrosine aminotransferase
VTEDRFLRIEDKHSRLEDLGRLKESIFAYLANTHPKLLAIKLDAATKEDFVWGLRIGFITYSSISQEKDLDLLYQALEKKTAGAIRGSISNVNHLGQEILLNALKSRDYQKEKNEKINILKERAEEVKKVLSNSKYKNAWDVYPFNSGYFMCIRLKTVNAEDLRKHLLNKYGVGLISLNNRDLRIAFSGVEKEDISTLFDTILQGIKELQKQ